MSCFQSLWVSRLRLPASVNEIFMPIFEVVKLLVVALPGLVGRHRKMPFKELFQHQAEVGAAQVGNLTSLLRLEHGN